MPKSLNRHVVTLRVKVKVTEKYTFLSFYGIFRYYSALAISDFIG